MAKKEVKNTAVEQAAIDLFAMDTMPVALKRKSGGGRADETKEQILQIFAEAKKAGKTELNSKQVLVAYLRMFDSEALAAMSEDTDEARELAKKATHKISCKLFNMTAKYCGERAVLNKDGRGLFSVIA